MSEIFNTLTVKNEDLTIKFSCNNYRRRIREAIQNLGISHNEGRKELLKSRFSKKAKDISFFFNGEECDAEQSTHTAYFFENTDYPFIVEGNEGKEITELQMHLSGHGIDEDKDLKNAIGIGEGRIYGTLNFGNQVGLVDFGFSYNVDGIKRDIEFTTEVLSYKMDYRTDMKSIIKDIEHEYSMLSYSFLKDTYLSFRTKAGESSELIWWQIFQSCYQEIVNNTHVIINSPKRRLKTAVRYERAERMRFIGQEYENEYANFKDEPNHLYRSEEMYLSKDTIENRFLKYVIKELHRKFSIIREHIKIQLNATDMMIASNLDEMDKELTLLQNHRFFKGIGQFKGFTQDSLVMKRARGYKDIFKNWVELSCGYELEDGMRKLEVKDISELYEIWCFIKVKNIVNDLMGGMSIVDNMGKELTTGFIRQLVYGSQSEVVMRKDNVEVSVMYNAQVEEANQDDELTDYPSAIAETKTLTTIQRPDIVLRLSKDGDDIKYTYLFDAKYRIADKRKRNLDVPPVDAINQMHRYRDAIYYANDNDTDDLKREIIGGYVLYPGNIRKEDFKNAYYKRSIDRIGIGAFPLKPSQMITAEDGSLIVDPNSSEQILREQIEAWLKDDDRRKTLLERSIPQHGLTYDILPSEYVLVGYYKEDDYDIIISKKIYYVRAGMRKGSINLITGFDKVSYILLYHDKKIELFTTKESAPILASNKELKNIGFAPHGELYFVYTLCESQSVVTFEGKQYEVVNLRTPKNIYDQQPYITTLKELLKSSEK